MDSKRNVTEELGLLAGVVRVATQDGCGRSTRGGEQGGLNALLLRDDDGKSREHLQLT